MSTKRSNVRVRPGAVQQHRSAVVLCVVLAFGVACAGEAARAPDDSASPAAAPAAAPAAVPAPVVPPPPAEPTTPPRTYRGHVVMGVDEISFQPCGTRQVQYLRMNQRVRPRVVQEYRFRASRPLSPMFIAVKGHLQRDTITVGPHHYTAILDATDYVEGQEPGGSCPAPPTGSLAAPGR